MQENQLIQQLKTLTEIPGPVGRELLVQTSMEEHLNPYCTVIHDPVGNLMAHFPGDGPKTVVAAHACEIGFVVKGITSQGMLKIAPNYKTRSPDTRILPFHDVSVLTDAYQIIDGFLTINTGHVIDAEARKHAPDLEEVLVDVGANSRTDVASLGVGVGSPVIWSASFKKLKDRVKGKAMDDRLGLTVLLRLAEFFYENNCTRDLYLASTVQEEIGVRGARALASQYTFDEAYILEIIPTFTSDTELTLGEGPAIVYKDGSMHYHHDLLVSCKKAAQENTIPLQSAILERGITDGLGFFINCASKTVLLGCPTLYPHSPGETIDVRDLSHLIHFLEYILL